MCAPSWSASDNIIILSYFKSSILKSSPMLVSKADISERISSFCKTWSMRLRSAFRGLPLKGNIAWKRRLRACFADPPAESPSTINSSFFLASRPVQLASLPIRVLLNMLFFWRVTSFALRAASRTLADAMDFLIMVSAVAESAFNNALNASVANASHAMRASTLPNFVLVCPSNWTFDIFTDITKVIPSRKSSPIKLSSFALSKFLLRA